jgi:transcriptional regulator with PAS, ATPase and Fis domain
MNHRNTPLFGVLVVDAQETVQCATGFARNPNVQKKLLQGLTKKRQQGTGLVALEGDERLLAIWRASDDAVVFFIHSAASEPTLFDFVASVDFAHVIFNYFINSPYEAMVVVDDKARLKFVPPVHATFFGLKRGEGIGEHVTKIIENTNLHEVVRTGKAEIGKLQEMGGVTRVVARVPIIENGKTLGAIGRVMFKGPETVHELSSEVTKLRSEVEFYRRELSGLKRRSYGLEQMVGKSDAIRQLKADIVKVAPLYVPVLIVGESGTGKELAAHAMHALSPRNENPMVFVNAAALPSGLVESELFGYEAGAFTGAEKKGRKGKFELADRSSLFFDEIGDMPPEIQVKLLRVLQDGMFERVGGDRARHSDFRLICASNRNFQEMISTGEFRLDLYYRISGVTIRMPSLRERLEDVPDLVESFLTAFAKRQRTSVNRVDPRVYDYLRELPWPGNVRQLLHEVEKAAIFCEGPEITIKDFRPLPSVDSVPANEFGEADPTSRRVAEPPSGKIQDAIEEMESAMIRAAMQKQHGNKKKVAEELGISRAYLYKKLSAIK